MNLSEFTKVMGVKFRDAGRVYYYNADNTDFKLGEYVVANTPRGEALGRVIIEPTFVLKEKAHLINLLDNTLDKDYILANLSPANLDGSIDSEPKIPEQLPKIIRKADKVDFENNQRNLEDSKYAQKICEDLIDFHKLPMKLVKAEFSHNGKKAVLYFTARGRIDFRNLVKDLLRELKVRIELRQIDVRDETKLLSGIGTCGRQLCCSSFLRSFKPVSIKMAKDQNLALNPTKISGMCGRLMCCLTYELDTYNQLRENFIKIGTAVQTPDGEGKVYKVNVFSGIIQVLFESGQTESYNSKDLKIIGSSGKVQEFESSSLEADGNISEEELSKLEDPKEIVDIKDTFIVKPAPRDNRNFNNNNGGKRDYNKDNNKDNKWKK